VARLGGSRAALTVVAKTCVRHGGPGSLNRANKPEGVVIEKLGKGVGFRGLRPGGARGEPEAKREQQGGEGGGDGGGDGSSVESTRSIHHQQAISSTQLLRAAHPVPAHARSRISQHAATEANCIY